MSFFVPAAAENQEIRSKLNQKVKKQQKTKGFLGQVWRESESPKICRVICSFAIVHTVEYFEIKPDYFGNFLLEMSEY